MKHKQDFDRNPSFRGADISRALPSQSQGKQLKQILMPPNEQTMSWNELWSAHLVEGLGEVYHTLT